MQLYDPVAPQLDEFGARFNLLIIRYPKESTSWDYHFLHPRGGTATIQLVMMHPDRVSISVWGRWEQRDFEAGKRKLFAIDRGVISMKDPELISKLETLLRDVLNTPEEALQGDGLDYRALWAEYDRNAYKTIEATYPLPRLNDP